MLEQNWLAVYTKARSEKKVSELLSKKQIENYCPVQRVRKQWADRQKTVTEPLFPSYVFVRLRERQQIDLLKTDGVINFVYWLKKPAVIKDVEITSIREFLADYENITLERTAVNVSDTVRVITGPLVEQEGHVVAVKKNTVKIILPSLGYMMSAEIEIAKIEVIKQNSISIQPKSGFAIG